MICWKTVFQLITFTSVSPYHGINCGASKGKINICRVWREDSIRYLLQFYLSNQINNAGALRPFLILRFYFIKPQISVRSSILQSRPFFILEPIPFFLFKASNLQLYFGIFLQMTQPDCYKTIARLKHTPRTSF